jgi:hypothetical protein
MNIINLLLYSTLTVLILEYLSKKTIRKVIMLRPDALIINIMLLSNFILFFYLITKELLGTLIVITVIMIVFGIANRIKIDYRQTGFTPLDFLILREAKSMAGALNKKSMLKLIFTALISLALLLSATQFINEPSINTYFKNGIIIISIILPLIFYFLGPLYNQKISVFKSGTILYFFSFLNDPPKIRIANRKRDLQTRKLQIDKNLDSPDVIIIQSESFVDPLVLGEDKFNKDPLPFYRDLLKKSCSFSMSTRAFGGGTVHTEYEILTGLSTVFFPRDTTVFSRYIKEPLPSIGSILNMHGYQGLLIHPYLEWYYNRTNVYRKLGFDRFMTLKSFETKTENYVSDMDVFNRIIHELNTGNNLIVAVTMQNHTPYNRNSYRNGIEYLGNFSNHDTKIHFNNYLNGLSETDKSLAYLIDRLKKRDKETILLFYGDHLPVINQDAAFYEESLWSDGNFDSNNYYYDLSKSPGFIWSNKKNLYNNNMDIDATAVLPILLKELDLDSPEYISNLDTLLKKEGINGFFRDYLIKDGELYNSDHPVYKKLYKEIKKINEAVFNDAKYDKWCFDNDAYEVN